MSLNTYEFVSQEDILLLNKLTRMLEEQVNIIQCSDVSGKRLEAFVGQIQSIVDEVNRKELLNLEQFKDKREHIKRLYDNLSLAVIAKKNETNKQLNHIRKGKKTLNVYQERIKQ